MPEERPDQPSELKRTAVAAAKIGLGFGLALVVLFLYVIGTLVWYFGNPGRPDLP